MLRQSFLSLDNVKGAVTATGLDGVPIDPATLEVRFAFMTGRTEPAAEDWHAAVHLGEDVFGVLVGPGALVLARGTYTIWYEVTDNPEKPVDSFGTVRIE